MIWFFVPLIYETYHFRISRKLLQEVYDEVITSPQIAEEFRNSLPVWIKILSAKNVLLIKELEQKIDSGEVSAIALSLEIPSCTIILDDLKARQVASSMKLDYTGTLGVIIKAKKVNIIDSVIPILQRLRTAGLRFSDKVEKDILNQAGE
jgi:predicted nucleic acid-binding protein